MWKSPINAILSAVILVAPLAGQRGARAGLRILTPAARTETGSGSFRDQAGHRGRPPQSVYLGNPYWWDDGYSQAPSVYVIQPQLENAQRAPVVVEEAKPAAPLMIELQGGRYVRHTGDASTVASSGPDVTVRPSSQSAAHPHREVADATLVEPPPAVFVFRDGHREDSSNYSIISGIIYTSGNYWTSGSWSRKILISNLDLPATLKANQERGAPFRLPSAANEVITRP